MILYVAFFVTHLKASPRKKTQPANLRPRFWCLGLLTFLALSNVGSTVANPSDQSQLRKFHISAKSLDQALIQTAEQSEIQLLMQGRGKKPGKAFEYSGKISLGQLLTVLLSDSNLEYEILSDNILVVRVKSALSDNSYVPHELTLINPSRLEEIIAPSLKREQDVLGRPTSFKTLSVARPDGTGIERIAGKLDWIQSAKKIGQTQGLQIIKLEDGVAQIYDPDRDSVNIWFPVKPNSVLTGHRFISFTSARGRQSENTWGSSMLPVEYRERQISSRDTKWVSQEYGPASPTENTFSNLHSAQYFKPDTAVVDLTNMTLLNQPIQQLIFVGLDSNGKNYSIFVYFDKRLLAMFNIIGGSKPLRDQIRVNASSAGDDKGLYDNLRLGFAAYHSNIEDFQIGLSDLTIISNALDSVPDTLSRGFEFSIDGVINHNRSQNLTGRPLENAPAWRMIFVSHYLRD